MAPYRRLLYVFPRTWRARYGAELSELLSEMEDERGRVPLRGRLDVARAGLGVRTDALRAAVPRPRHTFAGGRALAGRPALATLAIVALLAIVSVEVYSEAAGPGTPAPSFTGPGTARALTDAADAARDTQQRMRAAAQASLEREMAWRTVRQARSLHASVAQAADLLAARRLARSELEVELRLSERALADARAAARARYAAAHSGA